MKTITSAPRPARLLFLAATAVAVLSLLYLGGRALGQALSASSKSQKAGIYYRYFEVAYAPDFYRQHGHWPQDTSGMASYLAEKSKGHDLNAEQAMVADIQKQARPRIRYTQQSATSCTGILYFDWQGGTAAPFIAYYPTGGKSIFPPDRVKSAPR